MTCYGLHQGHLNTLFNPQVCEGSSGGFLGKEAAAEHTNPERRSLLPPHSKTQQGFEARQKSTRLPMRCGHALQLSQLALCKGPSTSLTLDFLFHCPLKGMQAQTLVQ